MAKTFKQIKTILDTAEEYDRSVLEKKRKAVSDASIDVDLTKTQNTINLSSCPSSPLGSVTTNAMVVTPEAPDNKKEVSSMCFRP